MIRLKTAVLIGCALKMGALIADASQDDLEAIYEFGELLGIAFQILYAGIAFQPLHAGIAI